MSCSANFLRRSWGSRLWVQRLAHSKRQSVSFFFTNPVQVHLSIPLRLLTIRMSSSHDFSNLCPPTYLLASKDHTCHEFRQRHTSTRASLSLLVIENPHPHSYSLCFSTRKGQRTEALEKQETHQVPLFRSLPIFPQRFRQSLFVRPDTRRATLFQSFTAPSETSQSEICNHEEVKSRDTGRHRQWRTHVPGGWLLP